MSAGLLALAVAAHVAGWVSGLAAGWCLRARADAPAGLSLPAPEPTHACLAAIEQAEAGRLHVSPSGRLVRVYLPDTARVPAILDACPWCRAALVERTVRGRETILTDAGQAHRRAVERAVYERRTASTRRRFLAAVEDRAVEDRFARMRTKAMEAAL